MLERDINRTDKEIDSLTYKLYGLTKAEIKIVDPNYKSVDVSKA